MRGESWKTEARCLGSDPDMWFATDGDGSLVAKAKQVCRSCPVLRECREYAVSNGIRYGVWGGLAERELRAAVSQRLQTGQVRRAA